MEFMETDSISPETGRPMFTSRLFIISLWLIFRPKTLSHKNFQTKVYFWYLKLLGRAENFCFDWSEWLFEWFYLSKEVTPGYKLVYLLGHSRKEYSKYHAKHQHLITTWQFEDHVTPKLCHVMIMSDVSNRPNRTWFVLLRNQMTIITQFKSLHNFQGILTSSNQLPPDLTSVNFSEQGSTDRYRLDQVELYFWEWVFQKLQNFKGQNMHIFYSTTINFLVI